MANRLSSQVFALSIAVAAVAALLTGLLVRDQTISAFEEAAARDLATDSAIYTEVSQFPFFFDDWSEAQDALDALSEEFGERIAITQLDGTTILADTHRGESLPDEPAAVLVSDVFGVEFDNDAFEACLVSIGAVIDDDGIVFEPSGFSEPEFERQLDSCVEQAEVDPQANALLYLGFGADPLDLGSLSLPRLLLGGSGVLAVAAIGAVFFARRLSQPVEALTVAAERLRTGDLGQRVVPEGSAEVLALGTSFNSMAARLEATEESRRQLVTDVAHELRNPIGVLQGTLEAAQDGLLPLDEPTVANLTDETRHLGQLVRDLQEITLAENAGLSIERQSIDLLGLCQAIVGSHGPLHPELTIACAGSPVKAPVDPLRFRQVIDNLVTNAATHTDPGGSVTVTVDSTAAFALVTVTDTGVGIAPADAERVFDRFWRADSSRTRSTGGSGLGLSISRAIVEAHGGRISVDSHPGRGSSFTVEVPLAAS